MISPRAFLMAVLVPLVVLPGCWSRRELKDINFVLGVGIDRTSSGFRMTAQFPIAARLAGAAGGGAGGGGGGGAAAGPATYVTTVEGSTLKDADRRLTEVLPGRAEWSDLQVIVVGEDLAREGLAQLTDFFLRPQTVRENALLLVARGKAADVIRLSNPLEPLPPVGIDRTLKSLLQESMTSDSRLIRFVDLMAEPGIDGVLPSIETGPGGIPRLGPLAVFKGDRLVGWLSPEETLGVSAIRAKHPRLSVVLPCQEGGPPQADVQVHSHESRLEIRVERGRLTASIKVNARGQLYEDACLRDVTQPPTRQELERLGAEQVRRDIEAAVQRSKELRADIFGFGRELYRHQPQEWKRRKDRWDEELAGLPVTVSVELIIDESGVINQPVTPR